jgi:hypothetical protein
MNRRFLRLFAAGLMAGPMCANAQITTLEYQSNALTGSTTYYSNPTSAYLLTPQQFAASFTTTPFIGNITASLNLVGGDSLSGVVNVMGYNGTSIDLVFDVSAADVVGPPLTFSAYAGSNGTVDLTTSNGAVTGATMDVDFSSYHGPNMFLEIGPSGDSVSYTYAGVNGPCTSQGSGGGPNPCTVVASSKSAGVWQVTRAPEIDPASAASGLTLLLGGLTVLSGRRKLISQ